MVKIIPLSPKETELKDPANPAVPLLKPRKGTFGKPDPHNPGETFYRWGKKFKNQEEVVRTRFFAHDQYANEPEYSGPAVKKYQDQKYHAWYMRYLGEKGQAPPVDPANRRF